MTEQHTLAFKVGGMTCAGCTLSVEYALQSLEGIQSVEVNYLQGGLTRVEFEPGRVTPEQIAQALDEAGYRADFSQPNDQHDEDEPETRTGNKRTTGKPLITALLLAIMVAGAAMVAYTFSNNRESLPVSLGEVAAVGRGETMTLSVVDLESYQFDADSLDWFTDDISPAAATSSFGERAIRIPAQESQVTILLSGLAGCATCGIEAQTLSRLQNEYGTEAIRVVFVDIYNYGGPENLAWFANMLEATNLIWTIDTDGSFKQAYQVDVDSTVIMDRSGDILYRDHVVTPYETLKEQVEIALAQS